MAIPCGEKLLELLELWKDIMTRNSEQLKVTAAEAASWNEANKREWWTARQQVDKDLNALLAG